MASVAHSVAVIAHFLGGAVILSLRRVGARRAAVPTAATNRRGRRLGLPPLDDRSANESARLIQRRPSRSMSMLRRFADCERGAFARADFGPLFVLRKVIRGAHSNRSESILLWQKCNTRQVGDRTSYVASRLLLIVQSSADETSVN